MVDSTARRRVRVVDAGLCSDLDVVVADVNESLPDDVDIGRDELVAASARAAERTRHSDALHRHCHSATDHGWTQWRRNYGNRGVHCTPPPPKFRTCTPCTPQVKDAAYVNILSKRL